MTPDTITSFLTYYIRSLAERTRKETAGAKYGIDWIIYNLGLALDWKPVRLPWVRAGVGELSKTKTEAEFGVDFSFLRNSDETLVIFALKDEVLSYKNWIAESFDSDLRRAATTDLTAAGLEKVKEVVVILAYNKDEDQAGIDSFDQTVRALGTRIGDRATLRFERWNLTEITAQVKAHLLTPSLLPQNFYAQFSYICAQVGDFVHGSDEWLNQLVPNWRRFLSSLVRHPMDERLLRLLPVTLVILRAHGTQPSSATGWLDLAEWAMLAAWDAAQKSTNQRLRLVVSEMWTDLYVEELERFYTANAAVAAAEHGLETRCTGTSLDAIARAFVGFWHTGRLGLLAMALQEQMVGRDEAERPPFAARIHAAVGTLTAILSGNPSTMRPVLDLQHIELFLVWRALWVTQRTGDMERWLGDLQQRLLMRRFDKASVPFILGTNSWEIAFERAADERAASYVGDHSSYLLLMVLELCCVLPVDQRDDLLRQYFLRIIRCVDDDGAQLFNKVPIDLMGWAPPADWESRILTERVSQGVSIVVNFAEDLAQRDAGIAEQIRPFVDATRAAYPFRPSGDIPISALVLACLKHQSPVPAELWRELVFRSQ